MVFADVDDEPLPPGPGISQSLSKENFSSFYSLIGRLGRVCYQDWSPTRMKIGDVYIRPGAEALPQVAACIPTNQLGVPEASQWQALMYPKELQQGIKFSDNYTRFIIPRCQNTASQVSFSAFCFVSNGLAQGALKMAWLSQAHHIFEQTPAGQTWGDHRACLGTTPRLPPFESN
ncbi:hypothetical protein BD779DRAFT_608970 [Infundibulicybe gibba]|nr:hypothetical protein BD779DRAFT_608970 [Infundibulicybe gibba]